MVELGQAKRAEVLLERAIQELGGQFARNRTLYRVRLARARLDSRQADGAAEAANTALDDLETQVASWRVEEELAAVAARLGDFRQEQSVTMFLDRYHARR
jgi:hypothetical protein